MEFDQGIYDRQTKPAPSSVLIGGNFPAHDGIGMFFYFSFGMLGWASRNSAIKVSIDWLALHETLLPSGVNFTGLE